MRKFLFFLANVDVTKDFTHASAWRQCWICPQPWNWTLNVCASIATQLRPLSSSSPIYLFLFQPSPPSTHSKWGPVGGVGKYFPFLPLLSREGGIPTKEIPKVPLQWQRWTLQNLACSFMLRKKLKYPSGIHGIPLPYHITYNDFFLLLSGLFVRAGGCVHVSRGDRREEALPHVLTSSFAELPLY